MGLSLNEPERTGHFLGKRRTELRPGPTRKCLTAPPRRASPRVLACLPGTPVGARSGGGSLYFFFTREPFLGQLSTISVLSRARARDPRTARPCGGRCLPRKVLPPSAPGGRAPRSSPSSFILSPSPSFSPWSRSLTADLRSEPCWRRWGHPPRLPTEHHECPPEKPHFRFATARC